MEDNIHLQPVLDNCLVLIHDFAALPKEKISNEVLIKIFVRSALKVPSTSWVQQYFTDHVLKKSAIGECKATKLREWCKFYNSLRKRKGYESINRAAPAPLEWIIFRVIKNKQNVMDNPRLLTYFQRQN